MKVLSPTTYKRLLDNSLVKLAIKIMPNKVFATSYSPPRMFANDFMISHHETNFSTNVRSLKYERNHLALTYIQVLLNLFAFLLLWS